MSSSQESETKVMNNKDPMPSDSKLASEDSAASSPESEDSEEFSFMLKPGEFMHDADSEIDHSLEVFTRTFCTKDTYAIFSDYSRIIRQSEEYSASNFEDHDLLNRYNDIPCFDSTRVSVKHPEEEHDYIHANYVDGFREPRKFILTQAPINDNLLLEQFWEMVWKEKVVEIVAMCVLDGVKCPQYLPVAAKQQRKFGPFIIQHIGTRQIRKAYDATMLLVKRENTNENEPIKKEPMRRILHLSFHRWPDKGTPIMPTEVINFIEDMNYNRDVVRKLAIADGWLSSENEITPIIVHCIAGVGRSGSLVALDICQRKMDYTSQLPSGPLINIERVVSRMRCQRAMAIQKPEQFGVPVPYSFSGFTFMAPNSVDASNSPKDYVHKPVFGFKFMISSLQNNSMFFKDWLPGLKTAYCESEYGSIPRANHDQLQQIFNKYASLEKNGKKFMTEEDFVRKYLGLYLEDNYNTETVRLLASAADTSKDGLISFEEFSAFEATLCAPDALYLTAFDIFDNNASESITADEFEKVIRHTTPLIELDFDFNSEFIKKYFGAEKTRQIGYLAFCQLLHDFYEEQGLQGFRKFDKNNDGSISVTDFYQLMTTVKGHLLTEFTRNNLIAVASGNNSSHNVRFPFYQAFNSLLAKMELFKRIYMSIARGNIDLKVTKEEFLQASQVYAQITPYEVEILFHLCELAHPGQRLLDLNDLDRLDPERLKRGSQIKRLTDLKAVKNKAERGVGTAVLESAYRFTLGSVAGACGATAVYPIDLIKTRMQNQRTGSYLGEVAYKNSFDCLKKVVKFEGLMGLYRGLLPQIIGVAPEKAIKLTMNDFMRDKLASDGRISLPYEILAGGSAGASQVVFTNPLEIVKIRLQVAGEITTGPKGLNNPSSLFASAFISGVPAAALVTPADVIKTRLQVAARAGQTTYNGVIDCAKKIMKEEGPLAFWKGTVARVCRSSPQFAVTLLSYELFQRVFYVDFGGTRPTGSEISLHATVQDQASGNPDHIGGYRLAAATFSGIEHKFGLFLPRFEAKTT